MSSGRELDRYIERANSARKHDTEHRAKFLYERYRETSLENGYLCKPWVLLDSGQVQGWYKIAESTVDR